MTRQTKVLITYHFFPHYRTAVFRELSKNNSFNYIYFGDIKSEPGSDIPVMAFQKGFQFVPIRSYYLGPDITLQPKLIKIVMQADYDVIIFLGVADFLTNWIAAPLARWRGKRVLFWTHGWTHEDKGLKKIIRSSFYRLADALLFYGHYAKNIAVNQGFNPDNLYVIYNSLDYEKQKTIRKGLVDSELRKRREEMFPTDGSPVVITIGRLIRGRGVELLIDALALLKKSNYNVNLIVVGDGPFAESLQQRASEKEINACFKGKCYDDLEVAQLISLSDIAVAPGLAGLTVMHVLAYGTPIIVPNGFENQMPEWEAVQPGVNGDYFEPGNFVSLAESIKRCIIMKQNKKDIKTQCITTIEDRYNPFVQARLIERAIMSEKANDLWHIQNSKNEEG